MNRDARGRFVRATPTIPTPIYVAVADHAIEHARKERTLGELRRWREADRIFPVESSEWWDATLRLRDVADRLGGAAS